MAPPVESKTAELLRNDFTGTIWFGAAVIGAALPPLLGFVLLEMSA